MILFMMLAMASVHLPLAPKPAPPFPAIRTDAVTITDIAPGVTEGSYRMQTQGGPLVVRVIAVDPDNPTVRLGTVLAHNRLVSAGETVSSMAARTGAVAGINGDYFDINQTNQPLNLFIANAKLVRMPMDRPAFAVSADGSVLFAEFHIEPKLHIGDRTVRLQTINDWPPPGEGTVLLTPAFGTVPAAENVTLFVLDPLGIPPFCAYRIRTIADNTAPQPPAYYLAVGLNAYGSVGVPANGTTIAVTQHSDPPIDNIVSAVGGGPMLVRDGAWFADPRGPSKGEFATQMPASGIAQTADGRLLLFEIDGRQPERSVGLLQPQFAALMIAFGAVTGMQFDGGGSSTIVARQPGDREASVLNAPSDGRERNVGDGLFVYSTAPYGPAARVVVMPSRLEAMPGARIPLRIAVTDAAGHPAAAPEPMQLRLSPATLGTVRGDQFIAGTRAGSGSLLARSGALTRTVAVDVTSHPAQLQILPLEPVAQPGQAIQLRARAFDARGYRVALPRALNWSTTTGTIGPNGLLHAGNADGVVSIRVGHESAQIALTVGEHTISLPFARITHFATAPAGGPGGLSASGCSHCVLLRYDFGGTERAAYVDLGTRLPMRALAIQAQVRGDGGGEILRLSVNNAMNERFWYTMRRVDWRGWRTVTFRFPAGLPQPITLEQIYVINRVGPGPAAHGAGSIRIRALRVVLPGRTASRSPHPSREITHDARHITRGPRTRHRYITGRRIR